MGLTTIDINNIQHTIPDYEKPVYSNHYSQEGSGFGFLTFTVRRLYGLNYPDIGYGYSIIFVKGMHKVLFKGIITKVEEGSDNTINVSAVGFNTLTSFDIKNFVLADNRTNRWSTACVAKGSYRPDKFDHSLSWTIVTDEGLETETTTNYDGVELKPRRGVEYSDEDYYYIRYRFEFGETAKRLTGTYKLSLPNNWPGKVEILDGDATVLWQADVSGNGTLNLDLDQYVSGNFVEIRFEVTAAGVNTAEDETIYFRLWDILVISTDDTLDASVVLNVVAEHMHTYYGFDNDYSLINTIGYEIPQAAYDADETLDKIANNACSFGDINAKPLAWGTAYDGTDRLFLEVQNFGDIGYTIQLPEGTTISGDIVEAYQKAYGIYTDTYGQTQRTDEVEDVENISKLGGLYRKNTVKLEKEMTEAQANQAVQLAVNENGSPKITTSFTIKDLTTNKFGCIIPFDELRAGKMVQIPDLKAIETSLGSDKRRGFHTFMLTKVEVDFDGRTVSLTPADDLDSFETYMSTLKRLSK